MLDQSFSSENFRRIYDLENRVGRNVDKRFFPEVAELSSKITAKTRELRQIRHDNRGITAEAMAALLLPQQNEIAALREERVVEIDKALTKVSANLRVKRFGIELEPAVGPKGMKLYRLSENVCAHFIVKQLQHNISRLYKLKPASRHAIVDQLNDVINTPFPGYLLRTDVVQFYENIDRKLMLQMIEDDRLLSVPSKNYIKQILRSYGELSGSTKGIPRGIGISAYLSELYMRKFDEAMRSTKGVVFYARYVDDIIVVYAPPPGSDATKHETDLEDALAKLGLAMNRADNKTHACHLSTFVQSHFDFLGYRFSAAGGNCTLRMSKKRFDRYKKRIDLTFASFVRTSAKSEKSANRLIVCRVRFLTGNTRLANSKRHAFTGIYYNNSALTGHNDLVALDRYLNYRISRLASAALRTRLVGMSFVTGFEQRKFYHFSPKHLEQIVEAWKYEAE